MRSEFLLGLLLAVLIGSGIALLTACPFIVRPPIATEKYRVTVFQCYGTNNKMDLSATTELLHHKSTNARHGKLDDINAVLASLEAESPEFDIPHDKIAELEARQSNPNTPMQVPAAARHAKDIAKAVARWQRRDGDVGSPEVQIAIAHERIRYLTAHMLGNKKDFASKRGLQALVVARRKMLEYLSGVDPMKARLMSNELGIRFQLPGQEWDKQTRYGAFRNTKSKHAKAAKVR